MIAPIGAGPGLAFAVRLNKKAAEIGDDPVYLIRLFLPPCGNCGIERIRRL